MKIDNNLAEISAEMQLNYFYPELEEKWEVHHDGTFYRNYNRDVIDLDTDNNYVSLSRDSFLRMLPEGILFDEKSLEGKDFAGEYKHQEATLRLFQDAFLPFDTFNFRQRLKIERNISKTLDNKLNYILKTYFGFDINAEENPYVREMARLLPFIRDWRADFNRLAELVGDLFHCKTNMIISRYSEDDNKRFWIPGVEFELLKADLSAEAFKKLYAETRPLEAFITEWLMPAEVHFKLSIKQHGQKPETGTPLILDYNIELNQ